MVVLELGMVVVELGIERSRDAVQIDGGKHALRGIGLVLKVNPVLDGAQIVAQVKLARRPHATENLCHMQKIIV
jgi:hypothetical protein